MFQLETVLNALPDFGPVGNGGTEGIVRWRSEGFSAVSEASVTYDGVTYSYASGSMGNISAATADGNALVTFNVWKNAGSDEVELLSKAIIRERSRK